MQTLHINYHKVTHKNDFREFNNNFVAPLPATFLGMIAINRIH